MTPKQTKNKSQKSAKIQLVNVQLSKDDLKELLTVVKKFISEEFEQKLNLHHHRMDCHNQRIIALEGIQRNQEIRRISYCPHDYIFKSIQYHKVSFHPSTITYKCTRCEMEWQKPPCFLTKKEKKALKTLGVILK